MPDKSSKDNNREIKKGKEDKSVVHNEDKGEKAYPRPEEQDRQFDNQPEFIDKQSSRKDQEEI